MREKLDHLNRNSLVVVMQHQTLDWLRDAETQPRPRRGSLMFLTCKGEELSDDERFYASSSQVDLAHIFPAICPRFDSKEG